MGSNESISAIPRTRFGMPLIVAWALSPAILIAVTCSVLDVGSIHPESEEFPGAELDAAFTAMFLMLYPLLVWQISKFGMRLPLSFLVAVPCTILGMLASFIIAFGACAVIDPPFHIQ